MQRDTKNAVHVSSANREGTRHKNDCMITALYTFYFFGVLWGKVGNPRVVAFNHVYLKAIVNTCGCGLTMQAVLKQPIT